MVLKKRQTRIGAALDCLCPLGFSKSLICSKVKSLLKVYGDEGWAFLEEDAYRLLIDVMLEEQQKHSLKNDSMKIEAASTTNQQPNEVAVTKSTCIQPEPEPELDPKLVSMPDTEPVLESVLLVPLEENVEGKRRWEDLPEDILASIFKRLIVRELKFVVPRVCLSWKSASLHPLCQKVIQTNIDWTDIDESIYQSFFANLDELDEMDEAQNLKTRPLPPPRQMIYWWL